MTVQEAVYARREAGNAAFQAKTAPSVKPERCLGVRVPDLRAIEKQFRGTEQAEEFLCALPHPWFDEDLLHSVFISNMKDADRVYRELERFLPYVDNWAVCDTLRPRIFKTQKAGLPERIRAWIASAETYTCRFGIDMLMTYYLDADFSPELPALPAAVHSDEYYVNMMVAWFLATALAKQWDSSVPYIENGRLDKWTHNKTIQKAIESYRITDGQKAYLRTLKT